MNNKHKQSKIVTFMLTLLCLFAWNITAMAAKNGWVTNPGLQPEKVSQNATYQVEVGQTFFLCDYARVGNTMGYYITPVNKKLQYSSSNPKVAAVKGSYGKVTTKAVGTAKITSSYGNESFSVTLKVKKKGSLKSTGTLKTINAASKKLASCYNASQKKANQAIKKNFREIVRAAATYVTETKKSSVKKLLKKKGTLGVPSLLRGQKMLQYLDDYLADTPTELKPVSVEATAGSDIVKITLDSPVTFQQIVYYQVMSFSNAKSGIKINENQAVCDSGDKYAYTEYIFTITDAMGHQTKCQSLCTFTTNSKEVVAKLYTEEKKSRIIKSGDVVSTNTSGQDWRRKVSSPAA